MMEDNDKRMKRWWVFILVGAVLLPGISCKSSARRSSIPPEAQTALNTAIDDIDNGRYDKLYQEAADEWRKQSSLDDSKAKLQKLNDTLGKARTRTLNSAREEQTSTAPIAGHSVTAIYQTTFDRGSGMEAFVIVENDGRWSLAKYYVTSSGLK
jgi:multidrug efflux pump subunit AcrA (membrane-fusion protein)